MISEDDVQKIARLARLSVEPQFIPAHTKHLNAILEHMEALNTVDTSGIEPMSHVHGSTNIFRADRVVTAMENTPPALGESAVPQQGMLESEALLQNAPDHSGRFIRVPLVIE